MTNPTQSNQDPASQRPQDIADASHCSVLDKGRQRHDMKHVQRGSEGNRRRMQR